ncbi:MAG: type II secretion system secretin GspD [Chromatiales bacterium]
MKRSDPALFRRTARALLPLVTGSMIAVAILPTGGCERLGPRLGTPATEQVLSTGTTTAAKEPATAGVPSTTSAETVFEPTSGDEPPRPGEIYRGQGVFARSLAAPAPGATVVAPGSITLNFEGTPLPAVVKVILEDVLKKNYVIDPAVSGTVNMQTSQPLNEADLLPVLEILLEVNGAALIDENGTYRVVPLGKARAQGLPPQVVRGRLPGAGFRTVIVPVRYVSVDEVHKLLQPFKGNEVLITPVKTRNLMILAGNAADLNAMVETIQIFDVDWMAGMSVGLFPLTNAEAKAVADELKILFADSATSPIAGLVRLVPIERLNAVLAVTPQSSYLDQVQQWIYRLDRTGDHAGERVYIYRVQNGKAEDLANVLTNLLSAEPGQAPGAEPVPPAQLAPDLEPAELSSQGAYKSTTGEAGLDTRPLPAGSELQAEGITTSQVGRVRIIADNKNNALVIRATQKDFRIIEAALRSLDVTPLQVLIEASIIEVTLRDELQYGIEWFFKNGGIGDLGGRGLLDFGAPGLAPLVPGFSYALVDDIADIRLILNALATESKINVLSSPSLMVLDNQTARIIVGDEVPVPTRQSTSNIDPNAPTVNEIQYRSTGVLLTVTPRVNTGGLVTMEINQEVTDVAQTTSSGIDAPTFQQRSINSTVAVNSGNTVVLGGLIRENKLATESGVPVLYKIPVFGKLFGTTTDNVRRTELLVLITPRAIRNQSESLSVTDEYREKLQGLKPALK